MFERYKKYFRQSYINNWVFPLGIWEFRLKILLVSLKMCSDACSPSREWFFVHSIYNWAEERPLGWYWSTYNGNKEIKPSWLHYSPDKYRALKKATKMFWRKQHNHSPAGGLVNLMGWPTIGCWTYFPSSSRASQWFDIKCNQACALAPGNATTTCLECLLCLWSAVDVLAGLEHHNHLHDEPLCASCLGRHPSGWISCKC